MSGKSQLANGVAQGVQYALLKGSSVSASSVQTVVRNGSSRSGVTATVTVNVAGPACYCLLGPPVVLSTSSTALSPSYSCTGTCPAPAAAPGAFLIITASYVYQPIMPLYSKISNTTVSDTVTVRLQ